MASSSSVTVICFSPQALARPNIRSPKPPKFSPQNSTRSPKIKLKSGAKRTPPPPPLLDFPGGEATTYTRLPPREDISLPSLNEWNEIKLSESSLAVVVTESENEGESDEISLVDDDDDDDDDLDVDYKVVEVFEGGKVSDLEFDNEDEDYYISEDEELDEGDEDEKEGLVFKNGKPVNVDGTDAYFYEAEDDNDIQNGEIDIESDTFDGSGEFDAGEVKEKGVPAVMRCFDRAKVFVKAGDGGNGVVAFRREKYVPLGGPSGGDGGRGGHIYVEVDRSMNSLLPFRNSVHFRADRGSHGQGSEMSGAKGEDIVVKVPPGTIIRESGKDEVLLELVRPGQKAMLLPGGRGGRGNVHFKSRYNKAPRIAENGEQGPEMWVELELKLVADVGIVGAPNAGKSTLLSVISAAQPAIANYPFTTLLPNLGVVSFDYDSTMVVADLPGLLEGAHRGFGLGHEFLRHTERCSALVHVVDGSSEQPEFEFDAVRLELELFNPELSVKPFVVAFNKMDLPEAQEKWPLFKESLQSRGIEPFCMSAVTQQGTREVIRAAYSFLEKNREANKETEEWAEPENLNHVAETIKKKRAASIDEFEITHDNETGSWHVVGTGLQRFVQMTNWRYVDSEKRLKHVLEACGVYKRLKKLGVKEGDTVFVGEMELVWNDSTENSGQSNSTRKVSTDSVRWPQFR